MNVLGYDPFLTEARARALGIELMGDLDDVYRDADFITVHMLPYWEGVEVESAVGYVIDKLAEVQRAFPGKPIVIGTTGFPEALTKAILQAGRKIPIAMSPNFAVGVNAVFKLAEVAAGILGEYKGSQAREVLMTLKEYEALRAQMEKDAAAVAVLHRLVEHAVPRIDGQSAFAAIMSALDCAGADERAQGQVQGIGAAGHADGVRSAEVGGELLFEKPALVAGPVVHLPRAQHRLHFLDRLFTELRPGRQRCGSLTGHRPRPTEYCHRGHLDARP